MNGYCSAGEPNAESKPNKHNPQHKHALKSTFTYNNTARLSGKTKHQKPLLNKASAAKTASQSLIPLYTLYKGAIVFSEQLVTNPSLSNSNTI